MHILDYKNVMASPAKKIDYPHIATDKNIANAAPIIAGTRVTVRAIAGYYQMGMDVDNILITLPHLTPAQVHAALSYYFDHQAEIDADLADNSNEKKWSKEVVKHPREKA